MGRVVVELVDQLRVRHRRSGVVSKRLEQSRVVISEGGDVTEAVEHDKCAAQALTTTHRREQRVARGTELEEGSARRTVVALLDDDRRIGGEDPVDELGRSCKIDGASRWTPPCLHLADLKPALMV